MRTLLTIGCLLLCACGGDGTRLVTVTSDGQVLYAAKPVTVHELMRLAREADRPIKLRASRNARWMHVQWVLAALHEAGVMSVRNGGVRRTQEIQLSSGYVLEKFDWPAVIVDGEYRWGLCEVGVRSSESGAIEFLPTGESAVTRSDAPAAIRAWARKWQKRGREEQVPIGWAVEATGRVKFGDVMLAFEALDAAGIKGVQLGLEALHPWDRDRLRLPAPPHDDPIPRWWISDMAWRERYPVNLPLASMSVDDKPQELEDDRVELTLTADGRILRKGKELSLFGLAQCLGAQAQAYERKQRRRGKEGFKTPPTGGTWSRLYVLLNADKDARWQHVQWVMAELAAARYYKLQFGTVKFPVEEVSAHALARRWAGRFIRPTGYFGGYLTAFLPTEGARHRGSHIGVELLANPKRYRFGGDQSDAVGDVERWIRNWRGRAHPDDRIIGWIDAPPDARFQDVVTVTDAFCGAGIEVVDYAGQERAPDSVRRLKRLPQ